MKTERSNILELIGTGKNKYHSCVITSYSIDLAFFEQLILPKLRNAGVTNINLFVDATMLEQYLASHLSNNSKKFNANYSITPVYISGAFHPKMLFLAGKDKGYLSVGSGNITSSGLLYNDEIWSTFYTSKEKTITQPIFKSAWEYILSLSSLTTGINRLKIDWISQHSQWINALVYLEKKTESIKGNVYSLLCTQQDKPLYKDAITTLSKNPKNIKIIAPYYNRSGALLLKIFNDLEPSVMHCVVDANNGKLPVDFKSNSVHFSDWSDVLKIDNSKGIQRLHAKIIQIEYETETVFIMGSANATLEAFGLSNRPYKNEEAIIVIKSDKPRDFLKELGINIPTKGTLDIQKTKNTEILDLVIPNSLIKIKHAELDDYILKIRLHKNISYTIILSTFDQNNELIESKELSVNNSIFQTSLTLTEGVFKVALYDLKTLERISTFGLIQNINILKKSNPDERLARIQSFEHLDIFNSLNYELVLDFLEQERVFKERTTTQGHVLVNNEVAADEGEIISEVDYNKNARFTLEEQISNDNITSMVEEFLDVLKIRDNQEEFSNNSEEMALEAEDDGMDNSTTLHHVQKHTNSKEGQRIKRKIENIIKSVNLLILTRHQNRIPQDVRSLNALFIGYHILVHFWEESYSEEISTVKVKYKKLDKLNKLESHFNLKRLESQINSAPNEVSYYIDYSKLNKLHQFIERQEEFKLIGSPSEPLTHFHHFITGKYIKSYTDNNMIFNFLNDGISSMLTAIKDKELILSDNQKVKFLVLTHRILIILNWKSNFEYYRDLLLLNMYELLEAEMLLSKNEIEDLREINESDLFKKYIIYKKKLSNGQIKSIPLNSHLVNHIIYSTQFGFCKLIMVRKDYKIDLDSPLGTRGMFRDYRGFFKVFVGQNIKPF